MDSAGRIHNRPSDALPYEVDEDCRAGDDDDRRKGLGSAPERVDGEEREDDRPERSSLLSPASRRLDADELVSGEVNSTQRREVNPVRQSRLCLDSAHEDAGRLLDMFGFASRTKAVVGRLQSLAQLELELVKAEGKQKATALGVAAGLGALAAVLVVYGIGFAFATAAAGLSEALPLWLSLLIVTLVILALAAIAGFLAVRYAKKATPPKPSQAIEEAQQTVETLRSHV
jgi:Putative Actinobacterial Holin-X, holin superfamily III